MRATNERILEHTRRYLDLIGGHEMSLEEQQAFIDTFGERVLPQLKGH